MGRLDSWRRNWKGRSHSQAKGVTPKDANEWTPAIRRTWQGIAMQAATMSAGAGYRSNLLEIGSVSYNSTVLPLNAAIYSCPTSM